VQAVLLAVSEIKTFLLLEEGIKRKTKRKKLNSACDRGFKISEISYDADGSSGRMPVLASEERVHCA
jgi:hypothetical protein